MFRFHARGGVSIVALQVGLTATMTVANAQDGAQALPPVAVDAPKVVVKRVARKPAVRTPPPRRPAELASTVRGQNRPVVVVTSDGGTNASLATPPIKQRFALPQES